MFFIVKVPRTRLCAFVPLQTTATDAGALRDLETAVRHARRQMAARRRWHEVLVKRYRDPVIGRDLLLVIQTDVTAKVGALTHGPPWRARARR